MKNNKLLVFLSLLLILCFSTIVYFGYKLTNEKEAFFLLSEVNPNVWVNGDQILLIRGSTPIEKRGRGEGEWTTIVMNQYQYYMAGNPSEISKKINEKTPRK
jgi:hypothetical protein